MAGSDAEIKIGADASAATNAIQELAEIIQMTVQQLAGKPPG